MTSSWQMPPELLAQPGQREIQLTKSAKFVLAFALVAALLFAGVGFKQIHSIRQQHQRYDLLTLTGLPETGHVKQWWAERQGKSTVYVVSYGFVVDGKSYEGRSYVSYRNYTSRSAGEALPVLYLPAQPQVSRLAIENPPLPYWMASIYFLMPFVFAFTILIPVRLQWILLASGTATSGVVTKVSKTRNGLVLRYDFKDGGGLLVNGKAIVATKFEVAEGSTVTVLYLPERSSKSGVYPSTMVQLKS